MCKTLSIVSNSIQLVLGSRMKSFSEKNNNSLASWLGNPTVVWFSWSNFLLNTKMSPVHSTSYFGIECSEHRTPNTHNHCLVVRIDSNDKSIGDVALLPDAKMASCHGQDIHTPLCLPSINQVYYVLSITYYVLFIYVLSIPYIICVRRSNTLFTLN